MTLIKAIFPVLILLMSVFCGYSVRGQERCGTVHYLRKQKIDGVLFEIESQFEQWLQSKKLEAMAGRSAAASYKIPVVVHVIHNGEPVGSGSNISDAQILSQLRVLNEDFRRENADAANTPQEFTGVAGAMDIEFILAKRDPEGRATNGIVRVQGTQQAWTSNDNYEIKSLSYWPAEDYMNIWVCNITDFLGYAQFPVSDLPGLENSSNNRLTDGVVLWYRSFGSAEDGNFNLDPAYNRGRTATHEISHFFGLRHIWGDDANDCSGTDYVDDTPNQGGYTSGCPAGTRTSCDANNMFQNFQDYTDDACMNLFTSGQIGRMQTVIENSPRRKSLLTSTGLLPPDPVANDLGIRKIISPAPSECSGTLTPLIQVRNYGTNTISSARVRFKLNAATIETRDITMSLEPFDSVTISFSTLTVPDGTHTVTFEILLTNGMADGDATSNDNTVTQSVFIPPSIAVPFTEGFGTMSGNWTISNPDQQITWEAASAPDQNQDNTALRIRFYDYENNFGEQDVIYSPVFDLTDATAAYLFFDLAHARYDYSYDELRVVVITGCRALAEGAIVYDSSGLALATAPSTRSFFVPDGADDWEREIVDLSEFAGQQYVQVAFIAINQFGNNLYLDNISVTTHSVVDASVRRIISPSVVTCKDGQSPVLIVQNSGTSDIGSMTFSFGTAGSTLQTTTITGLNIRPGFEQQITLPAITLPEGQSTFVAKVDEVDGVSDDNEFNNILESTVVINKDEDRIPLRQAFEIAGVDSWININPQAGMEWKTIATNFGTSVVFNAFNNPNIGDEAWLVSPVLNFSRSSEASLLFNISYAEGFDSVDDLRIMISTDCGNTYEPLDYALPETGAYEGSWAPVTEEDWFTSTIDLSSYAGESDVRMAFVIRNAKGNNLYLDNIEYFVTATPRDVEIDTQYSIFGYDMEQPRNSELEIGFNLTERQDVYCQIVNSMGKIVSEASWTDVLNQTFDLPLGEDVASGVYVVRLRIGGAFFGTRIMIIK